MACSLRALNYLHNMNPPIIYRDMKPSNVMIKPEGGVKLIDFGTAKEYEIENNADTTALGTRGYAAPEQFGDSKDVVSIIQMQEQISIIWAQPCTIS